MPRTRVMDEDNTDALVRYVDYLRSFGVDARDPEPGDEPGWEWVSVPEWGVHIHRVPAHEGRGNAWLAYGNATSAMGTVGAHRAPLVATARTYGKELPPNGWATSR